MLTCAVLMASAEVTVSLPHADPCMHGCNKQRDDIISCVCGIIPPVSDAGLLQMLAD
jgi:hypothetical protein